MKNFELLIATMRVFDNANAHFGQWHMQKQQSFWFDKLMEEVKELEGVLLGDHDGTIEHELTQIAGICTNWLAKNALELKDDIYEERLVQNH